MITNDAIVDIPGTEEWGRLTSHFEMMRDVHLRRLFEEDPGRGEDHVGDRRRPAARLLEAPRHG